jgi:hypothetical protein
LNTGLTAETNATTYRLRAQHFSGTQYERAHTKKRAIYKEEKLFYRANEREKATAAFGRAESGNQHFLTAQFTQTHKWKLNS